VTASVLTACQQSRGIIHPSKARRILQLSWTSRVWVEKESAVSTIAQKTPARSDHRSEVPARGGVPEGLENTITPQVGLKPDKYYGPEAQGVHSSTCRLQRRRTTLSSRWNGGLVLALAEHRERKGEQEDKNRDHDRECHPLAHPNLLSKASP